MAGWTTTMALALASLMFAGLASAQPMKSDTEAKSRSSRATRKASMMMGGDEQIKAAQQALKDKGHDPGAVDGRMGPKTEQALREFQKAQGMHTTGQLDAQTVQSLGIDGGRTSSTGEATGASASPATGGGNGRAADTATLDRTKDASRGAKK